MCMSRLDYLAGVRGAHGAAAGHNLGVSLSGTWDRVVRRGNLAASASAERLSVHGSQDLDALNDDSSAHGVAELMAEMRVVEDEYRDWLAQYPIAFMDPRYERAQREAHAARGRQHLSMASIFGTAAQA